MVESHFNRNIDPIEILIYRWFSNAKTSVSMRFLSLFILRTSSTLPSVATRCQASPRSGWATADPCRWPRRCSAGGQRWSDQRGPGDPVPPLDSIDFFVRCPGKCSLKLQPMEWNTDWSAATCIWKIEMGRFWDEQSVRMGAGGIILTYPQWWDRIAGTGVGVSIKAKQPKRGLCRMRRKNAKKV